MRISHSDKKSIVITSGDPSGIGPEVILKALSKPTFAKEANITIVGSFWIFKKVAEILRLDLPPTKDGFEFVDIDNLPHKRHKFGIVDPIYGKAALDYLMYGAALVEGKKGASLVTAPINKEAIQKAGFAYGGHTEFLSHITKSKSVTMMLVGKNLKVSLVTRHTPIKDVPKCLTKAKLIETIENTHFALRKLFRINSPQIAVASLNPHGGEGGNLGEEEIKIIKPAVKYLQRKIKGLFGPEPPDTLFYKAYEGSFDAVVCMYHDQALIPLKMVAFDKGVNLTIGLPFIRTSPGHGTGFDIAGKGKANPSSMLEAIKLAMRLS